MSKTYIGEFEELVMLTVSLLRDHAYGLSICDEIKEQTGRDVTIGAIHATIARLEEKGFVETYLGEPTKARGGRRKRLVSVTTAGQGVLRRSRDTRLHLWQQIPELSIKTE